MNPFVGSDFLTFDNRTARSFSPISAEQMFHKHQALLPQSLVAGKTVLDLGCGIGATGYWCLSQGAARYIGVEPQHIYAQTANRLLSLKYPNRAHIVESSLEDFMEQNQEQYAIVTVLAVLHGSIDIPALLCAISSRAREIVAIEELMPRCVEKHPSFTGIEFSDSEGLNCADQNASITGRGARISPNGLDFIMNGLGFESSGVLTVQSITDAPDQFNAPEKPANARYLMRFTRTGTVQQSVSEDLRTHQYDRLKSW